MKTCTYCGPCGWQRQTFQAIGMQVLADFNRAVDKIVADLDPPRPAWTPLVDDDDIEVTHGWDGLMGYVVGSRRISRRS